MLLSTITLAQIPLQPTGSGTEADPYLISSLNKLYWVAYQNNTNGNTFNGKYFKQTADIDASTTSTWFDDGEDGYYGWEPIGTESIPFGGSYDGNNYKITDLYINRPSQEYIGLIFIGC